MSEQALQQPAPNLAAMGADELAALFSAFNEVGSRLEQTHIALQDEVGRLSAELRRANAEIERSRRLAALGEMAAGIAHEVRNPLGSIRLYARMLEQDLAGEPEQCAIAGKIASAVTGLDEVVGDVLSFARELRASPQPTDAGEALERAIDASRAELGAVRWADPVRASTELACDPILAQQALVNVLRNAAQAGAEAGRPEIVLDAQHRTTEGQPYTVLSIRDAGPGVPHDIIERMFNPFFTTRAAGTGLGLPIVHRIMDAHGGRVVVSNNADREPSAPGATVELWFPIEPEAPAIEITTKRTNNQPAAASGTTHRSVA